MITIAFLWDIWQFFLNCLIVVVVAKAKYRYECYAETIHKFHQIFGGEFANLSWICFAIFWLLYKESTSTDMSVTAIFETRVLCPGV